MTVIVLGLVHAAAAPASTLQLDVDGVSLDAKPIGTVSDLAMPPAGLLVIVVCGAVVSGGAR